MVKNHIKLLDEGRILEKIGIRQKTNYPFTSRDARQLLEIPILPKLKFPTSIEST